MMILDSTQYLVTREFHLPLWWLPDIKDIKLIKNSEIISQSVGSEFI